MAKDTARAIIEREALWFEPDTDGMAALMDAIGDSTFVLIGEASHGAHECYRTRAELTALGDFTHFPPWLPETYPSGM